MKNFTYKGWKINGFVMLLVDLLMWGGVAYLGYYLSTPEANLALGITALVVLAILATITLAGFMMLEPNESRVLVFFGKYRGTFYETGFWWVNPFMAAKQLSLRARNLNVDPIKVNDKTGNPIMIGQILVWKLKDTYKAMFEIDSQTMAGGANGQVGVTVSGRMKAFESFVRVQSDAALREVAGMFAYDDNDDTKNNELTLRSGGAEINDILLKKLNDRLEMSGLEVVEARINYLAYSPEIAAVMLRRQQAAAIISAREKIVEGAVTMVKMALDKLSEEEIVELDNEKKAAMVSNLLVVLCADESAQPVVNTGTLYQ
jgi:regulator of protease activity HflC (stomatin/prohibitin superfamily)